MDEATKQALSSEIAGAQQALELRKAELDPLNKMTDQWRQAMMSAKAYTATQKEAAETEAKVFDARQDAYKRGEGDAGADRAEAQVRQQQGQLNSAKSNVDYSKEMQGLQQQLAMASAVTQAEKDQLAVEQQIANLRRDKTYDDGQLKQIQAVLEATKEWQRELSQLSTLNPQLDAIQKYNEQLATLNSRLAQGKVSQDEYNREKTKLDQSTLAARDPIGKVAQDQGDEIAQLQIVGKYRDADIKSLQTINELKRQGIDITKGDGLAAAQQITANNRMISDIKEAQSQLDQLSSAFGDSLSSAVKGALSVNRGALREALASLGGKLFDMGTQQLFKQLTPSVTQLFPGLKDAANGGVSALGKIGEKQMDHTIASASQEIAQAQINIANATLASALQAQGAKDAGAPGALPGPAGTNLSGSQGAGAPGALPGSTPGVTQTPLTPDGNVPGPGGIAQVIAPGSTVATAAGAGAAIPGVGGSGIAPQLPGNGIGTINPSQFSQAFPMPSFATSTIKSAGPPVSEADTARWNEVFGRDPTPAEAVNINKIGVERALDVTNNPTMKAQDTQWAQGNKDWKSIDPNMTNRDYVKSLEPQSTTTSTMTTPNPSFPQTGVGAIGNPGALMKLPEGLFGGAGKGGANPFGDLGSAQKAFGPQGMQFPQQTSASLLDAGGRPTEDALTQHMMQTYGLTREQATGAVGTMGYESGNFKTLQEMPSKYNNFGQNPGGYGYAQWTGPRRTQFMDYAKQNGMDPKSYAANQGFIDHELQGPYKGTIDALKQTDNPADASKAWLQHYEGMNVTGKGKIEGVPAVKEHADRAQQYYDQGVGTPRNQGIDTSPTGSISSAAKQAQEASQQAMQQAMSAAKSTQDQLTSTLKGSSSAFTENFSSLTSGIKETGSTALGAVPDMGSFSSSIQSMVSKLGSAGGGGGGLGGLGGLFGGGGGGGGGGFGDLGDFGDFGAFHSGGVVGGISGGYLHRRVAISAFRGAPKFHDGLNSDEFPAVLQRGERVLTNAQEQKTTSVMDRLADAVAAKGSASTPQATPASMRAAGSRINMVVNTKDANSFRYSQPQIMAQAHASMMRTAAKHN